MNKKLLVILFTLLFVLCFTFSAYAHGVNMSYQGNMSYTIKAEFDTGKPMSGAQIIIYAPDDPATPWKKGTCDENGQYVFVPDTSKEGTWLVQARKAGHGASINIEVGEDASLSGGTGYSAMQVIIMIACVVWGFVGTALFFKRRKN
ncbi:MAG: carboxypeptidase-like regulatory domain-containing protein [Clostridiales bacterium]|nr:carboxypeptidase-like regulatory domain-containing protein [Clostridiales bacterium]MCF8022914.1 carboxypeptidase-like regulatory domain-containing protein [Clostridiales bacterium]